MSRVAKVPIIIPSNVDVKINDSLIVIRGDYGKLTRIIHYAVEVKHIDNTLILKPRDGYTDGWVQAGTLRALLNSMVIGVTKGFVKKLQLVGVGYRVTIKDNILTLSLGFSHLINYQLLPGIIAECPSQNEIILKGIDKQAIGQVVADLRACRRPDPYKGKGVRYLDEILHIKEVKRK